MRHVSIFAVLLIAVPPLASGLVPDPGLCSSDEDLCFPWSNGNFDWFGPDDGALLWSVFQGTSVEDFDADGDQEIVVRGGGPNGAFTKSVNQPALPGWAKLEFDVESQAPGGSGNCLTWYDIRVVLIGALDPVPFVDTLAGVAPLLPVDYYNDEVLYWYGTARAGDHMVLDPLRAHITSNVVYPTFNDEEKKVWLSQHVAAIWVFYIASDPNGCALDNFVRTLEV